VNGPLAGRTVIVTRPWEEAEELAGPLEALGARVLRAPAIRLTEADRRELERAVDEASGGRFAWVAFTSAAGVRAWFDAASRTGAGTPRARVAAVGAGTAGALRDRGVEPDLVPERFTTEDLGVAFPSGDGLVLLPRADIATRDLDDVLSTKGWTPVRVDAYRTVPADELPAGVRTALRDGTVDAVTFTSASTVDGFAGLTDLRPPAVCIGPVTAGAARAAGFPVPAEADPHTVDGVVDAVVGLLGSRAPR
jgi:uroporphyrinogen-III synthase